eukprot:CAMPEP_0173271412 /NCGR_PEP_ID=MMETSP1143-20121109/800_1 /TAXON_ID=483371 /ORGANISM="non described non described, Strain CCMP2298" /LENGTH=118 /DNA_ID=CAMNT_0014207969 /DNA_START=734 /DNA_END=1090 /DNA_ORIENTATION=+
MSNLWMSMIPLARSALGNESRLLRFTLIEATPSLKVSDFNRAGFADLDLNSVPLELLDSCAKESRCNRLSLEESIGPLRSLTLTSEDRTSSSSTLTGSVVDLSSRNTNGVMCVFLQKA